MNINLRNATQLGFAVALALLVHPANGQMATGSSTPPPQEPRSTSPQIPLEFEANRGQAPAPYAFVAHGPTYSLALSGTQVALSLHSQRATSKKSEPPLRTASLALQLAGASHQSVLTGLDQRPGRSNYFLGSDPAKWLTGVPHFGRVQIAQAYPGIDLVFYGNPQQLEYDFIIAPGADPTLIRLNPQGATSVSLSPEGNAVLETPAGQVELKQPVSYQQINGVRTPVASSFQLTAQNTLSLDLGTYDHRYPLVVDPVLLYSAPLGGTNGNQAIGMDLDAKGNAYITGNTCSSDFPTTAGEFQTYQGNGAYNACQEAFLLKLDPSASTLLYSNFFGGSGVTTAAHVAVDAAGNAYVTGATTSANFPLIANIGPAAPQHCSLVRSGYNCPDGFIVKFNPSGSQMLFSSLLGGADYNGGFQVKLNPVSGDVVILGETNSAAFKPTPTTLETKFDAWTCANSTPCFNSFLLGLDPATGTLRYGTYLGAWYFCANGLAFDAEGDIYVAGTAEPPLAASLGKPTFTYAPRGAKPGGSDIYIAKLHEAENKLSLTYSTLIQGEKDDGPAGIAVDKSGNAYIVGATASLHLPTTAGIFQPTNKWTTSNTCGWAYGVSQLLPSPCGTAFVAKLGPTGALSFLTYLGGTDQTWGEAIAVDSLGNIWLTGVTSSKDFPFSSDAYHPSGTYSYYYYTPFLAEMTNNGVKLPFASPIAGEFGQSTDIRIDQENNVYVTGFASQVPATPGVYPLDPQAYSPLFVQKWGAGAQPALQLSATGINFLPTPLGGASAPQTVTVKNTGAGALNLAVSLSPSIDQGGPLSADFLESNNCGTSLAPGASCTISATFEPQLSSPACPNGNPCYPQTASAAIVIQSNAPGGQQSVGLSGTFGKGPVVSYEPVEFPAQAAGVTGPTQYLELQNMGDLSLMITSTALSGADAGDFQISAGGGPSCSMAPPGTFCSFAATFAPRSNATGTRTATLTLTDNALNSPQTIPLTATVSSAAPGLIVSPTDLSVGPVIIGGKQGGLYNSLTLTNPSTKATVAVTALTFEGANKADFSATRGNTPLTLPLYIPPGQSNFISVVFNPASGVHGLRVASLKLATNPALSGIPVIQLQGLAASADDPSPNYGIVPSPFDFGSIPVGQTSAPESAILAITNQIFPCANGTTYCGGPLNISSFAVGLSDFSITTSQANYCKLPPVTVPHGAECWYFINFSPVKAGNRNTSLTIKSNAPWGPKVVPLLGTGLAVPIAALSNTSLDFGPAAIKVRTLPLLTTLTNTGSANLTVTSVTASPNFGVASNTCTAPLAPNASCTIGASFTPPASGAFSGTLSIADNTHNGKQLVALSGSGINGELLRIEPQAVNFGTQAVNTASKPQTVTISNVGDAAVAFPEKPFRASANFSVQSTNCPAILPERASCTASVVFKPTSTYLIEGTLTLTNSALGSPQPVALSGTGK